ncbi:FG-GAP repeat domain-containing protein [Streptomyces sp. NPDC092296]|uniref:FG-GAP repeat domain-containing protein n=1 Tax=Streptomyces sp. NPDC092296 TaxID=3366012 RepID=UPI0038250262
MLLPLEPQVPVSRCPRSRGRFSYAFGGITDTNRDGYPDLVARDPSGNLWFYPGDAKHGLATPRKLVGTGWGGLTFIGLRDWDGDGNPDIIVKDTNGVIWNYPGNPDGTHGSRIQVSTGWANMSFGGLADWNKDGYMDVIARDSLGNLYLYPSDTRHGLSYTTRSTIGTGWGDMTFAGLPDWDGDGNPDIVARDQAGTLWRYTGTDVSVGTSSRRQISTDW